MDDLWTLNNLIITSQNIYSLLCSELNKRFV